MKYLVLFLVFLAIGWYWRSERSGEVSNGRRRKTREPIPQDIVPCQHCGVHLPRQDAIVGSRGLYCSQAHRTAQES